MNLAHLRAWVPRLLHRVHFDQIPRYGGVHPVAMSDAERENYVAWWLYESGLDVDELLGIAVALGALDRN